MILYALKCDGGHRFEAWLRDSAAFEAQRAGGQLACAVCGSGAVEKDLMAPAIASAPREAALAAPLSTPASPAEAALAELRRKLETEADYVGPRFAEEARRIHGGEATGRPIWGEATPGEAKALTEEGIPVAPLPWFRRRDA